MEGQQQGHTEHHQRHQLGDGGDDVDERRQPDAAQHQGMYSPDQHRAQGDGGGGISFPQNHLLGRIDEVAQRTAEHHHVGDVGQQLADPVAPGGIEADQTAETRLGVGEDATIQIGTAQR